MADVDPWLPERLRREAGLIRNERSMIAAAREALTRFLDVLRTSLRDSRLDTSTLDKRMPQWRQILSTTIMPRVRDTFGAGFRDVLDNADWSPDPHVSDYLAQVHNRLVNVADEIFDLITEEIDQGRRDGESIDQIADRIDEVLLAGNAERWHNRSRVIARTETIAAYNSGQFQGALDTAKILGLSPTQVRKAWLATMDTRTRESHLHTDGQARPLSDAFSVGTAEGPKSPLMFPGDPTGPANEVIQCRCTMRFEFDEPLARLTRVRAADATLRNGTPGGPVTTTATPTWVPITRAHLTAAAIDAVDGPPWHGVLAPEGIWTGDRRKFAEGSLRWRDLPLPLMWQPTTAEGHDGAILVGRIDTLERTPQGELFATGVFDTSPAAAEAARLLNAQMMRGVSVDVDDATFVFETMAGDPLNSPEEIAAAEDAGQVITDGRISGATLCTIPAFAEAYVTLTTDELDQLAASGAAVGRGITGWIRFDTDDGYALVASAGEFGLGGWLKQRRTPKGNGPLSGRWVDMFAMPVHGDQLNDFGKGSAIPHLEEVTDSDGNRVDGVYKFTPERQDFHKRFTERSITGITKHSEDDPGGRRPKFVFMGGGPAAGKSSVIKMRQGGPDDLTADKVIINPDIAKTGLTEDEAAKEGFPEGGPVEGIPEYQDMVAANNPQAAGFVHEESSYMAKQVTQAAIDEGMDALLDGTGDSSYAKLQKKVLQAKSKGYEIDGVYVTAPTELALIRAKQRQLKTGRGVPSSEVALTHSAVSDVVPELGRTKIMDKVELYDTTDGGEAVLIMEWPDSTISDPETAFNSKPRILEPARYETFLAKSKQTPADAMAGSLAMIDDLLAREGDPTFDGRSVPRSDLEAIRGQLQADLDNWNAKLAMKEHANVAKRLAAIQEEADTLADVGIPDDIAALDDAALRALVDDAVKQPPERRDMKDLAALAEYRRRTGTDAAAEAPPAGERIPDDQAPPVPEDLAPEEAPLQQMEEPYPPSVLSDEELAQRIRDLDTQIAEADEAEVEDLLAQQRAAVAEEADRAGAPDILPEFEGLSEDELTPMLAEAQAEGDWRRVDEIKKAIRATRTPA